MGSTDKGWIKLSRNIQDNFLWDEVPFTKAQAWIDLLLSASHKDQVVSVNGKPKTIKKGQVWTSQMRLEKRWGWSKNKVRRFLALLTEQQMIHIDGTTNGTTLTIEKWAKYQGGGTTNGTSNGTINGTPDGTTDGTHTRMYNKNVKEDKEGAALQSSIIDDPNDDGEYPWDEEGWFDEV